MVKYLLLCLLISTPLHSEVLDTQRVWREHIINDAASLKERHLVGSFQHPDYEDDIDLPYMLHIGSIQAHRAFYLNLTTMKTDIHPKAPIIVSIGDNEATYSSQNSSFKGVASTIRNSDSSVALKLFSYDELYGCTGSYRMLWESDYISVRYVTPALEHRSLTLDLKGLIETMEYVYGIPETCK
ncbi:hypothetical protein P19_0106 [Aeromonas phage P19]|uniref:Uncharacterized protein n=1 Tax=Aeromonas phage AS-szw TaxID=2026114 RepID=A0A291LDQ5_9CAUD|nr:hypothetical protein [Aeromonas phage AS-szw]UKM62594.1 hypothetical protein P19_0106 [Aeromonas phage P19]